MSFSHLSSISILGRPSSPSLRGLCFVNSSASPLLGNPMLPGVYGQHGPLPPPGAVADLCLVSEQDLGPECVPPLPLSQGQKAVASGAKPPWSGGLASTSPVATCFCTSLRSSCFHFFTSFSSLWPLLWERKDCGSGRVLAITQLWLCLTCLPAPLL